MTSEDVYDIKRWHKDGKGIRIIAELLGHSEKAVKSVIGDFQKTKRADRFNAWMIANDWNANKPSHKIVRTYGFRSVVELYSYISHMRSLGYKFKNRHKDKSAVVERMMIDWNSDMPVQEIVKKYGYKHRSSLCNVVAWHRSKGRPFAKRNGGVEKRRNNARKDG